jgi:hypothetical protein
MGAAAPTTIGLISALHATPGRVSKHRGELWIVAIRRKHCQSFERLGRGVVDSRPFRRGSLPGEFSTPVEKTVEIGGFWALITVNPYKYEGFRAGRRRGGGPLPACLPSRLLKSFRGKGLAGDPVGPGTGK